MGSARVPPAGLGVAPEPSLDKLVWLTGFRRDAENGNRDGCAPFLDGFCLGRLVNFLSREGREGGEVRRTGIFVETAA